MKGQIKVAVVVRDYTSAEGIKRKALRTDILWTIKTTEDQDSFPYQIADEAKLLSPIFDIATGNEVLAGCQLAMILNRRSEVGVLLCGADVDQLKLKNKYGAKSMFAVFVGCDEMSSERAVALSGRGDQCYHFLTTRQRLISTHLKDGKIEIKAEVTVCVDQSEDVALHQRLQSLADIFDRQDTGDFIIRCEGQDIHVHKVLIKGSPVLMAMLDSNMTEAKENLLHITDFPFNVVWNMFKFLYTGILWDDSNLTSLFMAADKYQIVTLKDICIERLISSLRLDNACEYLKLADDYKLDKLKEVSGAFICSHYSETPATSGWKTFLNPALLTFLFLKLASYRQFLLQ